MNRRLWLAVLIIIALVAVGVVIWLTVIQQSAEEGDIEPPSTSQSANNTPSESNGANGSVDSGVIEEQEVTVDIRDLAFEPATIKIRPGTTVTWVNEDTVEHNVVASDPNSTGGLPTSNETFGKGGSFSHTFEHVGVFEYHCTPHPFMQGTVEVVEAE